MMMELAENGVHCVAFYCPRVDLSTAGAILDV